MAVAVVSLAPQRAAVSACETCSNDKEGGREKARERVCKPCVCVSACVMLCVHVYSYVCAMFRSFLELWRKQNRAPRASWEIRNLQHLSRPNLTYFHSTYRHTTCLPTHVYRVLSGHTTSTYPLLLLPSLAVVSPPFLFLLSVSQKKIRRPINLEPAATATALRSMDSPSQSMQR